METKKNFTQPDSRFAGAPFFSWNDLLDEQELRRQIREMHNQGLGGAFLHPRTGMITPYLSQEYMDMYEACIDEGKRLGFDIWLYDEDRWPSGSVGGRITRMGPEYVIKTLMCSEIKPGELETFRRDSSTVGLFTARLNGNRISDLKILPPDRSSAAPEGNTILRVWVYYGRYGTLPNWFSDLLEPKVVERFMELTHGAFKSRFSGEFGNTIPGIFTDEPNWSFTPWTYGFPDYFREKKGYDIVPLLPFIFYRGEGSAKARYDFYAVMTDRFIENYTERIGRWCSENNLIFTGHMLHEDNLFVQTAHIGAAMPHYEFMQMPGIDHLSRDIADPLLPKQVASVAHQMGDRRVLTETYGTAGWNVTFEDMRWIGEWQYVLGVNFPCMHLAHYSLRGHRKRDFPASLHYQQPWWPHYRYFNTYTARLLYMLTRGSHTCDILVIHPIESAWMITDYIPGAGYRWDTFVRIYKDTEVARLNDAFVSLSRHLLEIHRDYDYGDERIMSRHGSVEGNRIRVGSKTYGTVIVPSSLTMRKTTLDLLREFRRNGGTVITVGPTPTMIEGVDSPELSQFFASVKRVSGSRAELRNILDSLSGARITVVDEEGNDAGTIYSQERINGNMRIFVLANISRDTAVSTRVSILGTGKLEEWNPENGTSHSLPCSIGDGTITTGLTFAPAGLHILVLDESAKPETVTNDSPVPVRKIDLKNTWSFTRNHPNAITLDYCQFRTDDMDGWSEEMPVLKTHKLLCDMKKNQSVTLRFTFDSGIKPPDGTFLVLETPEQFAITVNGRETEKNDAGYFWDISFRKISIGNRLVKGRNTIDLTCFFIGDIDAYIETIDPGKRETERKRLSYGMELESVYIAGDFRVKQTSADKFAFAEEPSGEILTGDLGPQGYWFYPGSMTYSQRFVLPERSTFKRAVLHCGHIDAVVSRAVVNGHEAGYLAWQPLELDITPWVKSGENTIEIEVIGSLRNLLGPHHHIEQEPRFTGPWHFEYGDNWADSYHFVPFGITGDVSVLIEN
ncbi:hypothetical protein LLG96_11390 [bacterium]|nr:hypothetical protein [bacterium]